MSQEFTSQPGDVEEESVVMMVDDGYGLTRAASFYNAAEEKKSIHHHNSISEDSRWKRRKSQRYTSHLKPESSGSSLSTTLAVNSSAAFLTGTTTSGSEKVDDDDSDAQTGNSRGAVEDDSDESDEVEGQNRDYLNFLEESQPQVEAEYYNKVKADTLSQALSPSKTGPVEKKQMGTLESHEQIPFPFPEDKSHHISHNEPGDLPRRPHSEPILPSVRDHTLHDESMRDSLPSLGPDVEGVGPGHVFVVFGSLPKLACDAWCLPSNSNVYIGARTWLADVGNPKLVYDTCFDNFPRQLWLHHQLRVWKLTRWDEVMKKSDRSKLTSQPWLVLANPLSNVSKCSAEWYVEGIRQFLHAVAADLQGTKPRNGRERHLVAVPIVGTRYGGGRLKSGLILKGIIRELFTAAMTTGMDVALVTNQKEAYAAALQERSLYDTAFQCLDKRMLDEAEKLVQFARTDNLVIFMGAGTSVPAGMPTWASLLSELEQEIGLTEAERNYSREMPNLDRAHFLHMRFQKLNRSLQKQISARLNQGTYSLAHAMLATLPVKEYITTNYDVLFENAVEAIGEKLRVLPYEPDANMAKDGTASSRATASAISQSKWLLKMHGCVNHEDDIVLTREHYIRYNERNQALAGIVQAMLITKHMLFFGFSLADDNFFHIVSTVRKSIRTPERSRAFGTAVTLLQNPIVEEMWNKELNLVHMVSQDNSKNNTNSSPVARAGRMAEIFLDNICARSFEAVDHLFYPQFDRILSDPDKLFRDAFLQFLHSLPEEYLANSSAFEAFKQGIIKIFDSEEIFTRDKRGALLTMLRQRQQAPNDPRFM